jgi:hypothetical protein
MVHMVKLTIFFSANCDILVKDSVKQTLGIVNEALGEKYLGLPTAVGRSTKEAFVPIPGNIWGLMGGWSEKLLRCVARETQINSSGDPWMGFRDIPRINNSLEEVD